MTKKNKLFNDPVHGFISIENELDFKIIEHPFFQRLRRISQLGLTYLVYPGAHHTRFHHALGAYHLLKNSLKVLRDKGVEMSIEERNAARRAILLHDIGHGPFSHALEHSLVDHISHEEISWELMDYFDKKYPGELSMAKEIFQKSYHRPFFQELISSQLDVDRLDYLKRDSFYTGVSEGVINSDRIISMLNVVNDQLVVEQKAIYSVEKFILSRRLMYWQVYLHKAVVAAEMMVVKTLQRAKELSLRGEHLFATKNLDFFLNNKITKENLKDTDFIKRFCELDEYDLLGAVKEWIRHSDPILSTLSKSIIQRNLFKLRYYSPGELALNLDKTKSRILEKYQIEESDLHYFFMEGDINQSIYNKEKEIIRMYQKDGSIVPFGETTENINMKILNTSTTKKYVCAIELF
ncbi:MAG: HD domain-containing protein [Flavobacteriales bacterium]|jgi:HD superfamily phosphohydrolase|nr:HD domain-containing protein [Flavobacteriales bacterium]